MSNGNYQETHERILKSGLAAFLEEGFEKANLRRICKAAGVTTGAFYKHFKDKEALFSELVEPLASMIRKAYAQGEKRGFAGYDEGKPVTPEQVRAALEAKAAGTLATTAMLYSLATSTSSLCSAPTAPPTSTSLTGSSTRRTGPPSAFSS